MQPTQPQLNVIGFIEANLGIRFTGFTKDDARAFISENIEASKASRRNISVKDVFDSMDIHSPYGEWFMDVYGEQY